MKIIILCLFMLFLYGCSEEFPLPELAIKACIDKGWVITYTSNVFHGTVFTCEEPGKTK